MNKNILGICIIIAAALISGTILYTSISNNDRYKVAGGKVFDTKEGKFVEEQKEKTEQTKGVQKNKSDKTESQILENSIVKGDMTFKETLAVFAKYQLITTIKNTSTKYVITYLEIDLKIYKDDVIFFKESKIIGDEVSPNINPLSSFEETYYMDPDIKYPEKPWRFVVTTKVVKGHPIE